MGGFLYVADMDGELICRRLDVGASQSEAAGKAAPAAKAAIGQSCAFRGDSRWVGFGRAPEGNEIVAATAAGGLYVATALPALAAAARPAAATGGGGAEDGGLGGAAR